MADNHKKIAGGITLVPQASEPANPEDGDIYYDSTLNKFRRFENGSFKDFASASTGLTPLGGVIGVFDNLTGATVPATGDIDANGYQLCDGAAINGSATLTGTIPDLTGEIFLAGSTAANNTGGSNTMAHTHSVTSNVTGTHDHTHAMGTHNHQIYKAIDADTASQMFNSGGSLFVISAATTSQPHINLLSGASSGLNVDAYSANVDPGDTISISSATLSMTNNAVTSGAASNAENRPSFISVRYVMRVL